MKIIRKISIGRDYKDDAMHYQLGQQVYGGHKIEDIEENEGTYNIHISKDGVMKLWKTFNSNMAISVEYTLDY